MNQLESALKTSSLAVYLVSWRLNPKVSVIYFIHGVGCNTFEVLSSEDRKVMWFAVT